MFLEYLFAALYGAVIGNLATTMYHRIPLQKPINGMSKKKGMKPHCSSCAKPLKWSEYLPIFSWITAPFKCNYCGSQKEVAYTLLELAGISFALFFVYNVGLLDNLILFVLVMINMLLMVLFYLKHKKIYAKNIVFLSGLLLCTMLII